MRLDDELGRHVVASRVLYHRRTRYLCGVGPGVRTLGRSRQAGDGVLVALQLKLRALEAGNALFRAVISVAAAVGLHRDLVLGLAVGHRQGAVACGDVVVISLGALLQCVAEEVFTAAHQRLAAGVAVVRALTVHKAVAGDLDFMLGKRRAVVLLFGALRRDRHIALGHRQGAGFRGHGKLARHIVIFGVLHRCRAGHVHGVAARIRPLGFRRQAGDRVLAALDDEGGFLQAGNALLRAVVLVAAAVGLHRDLVLGLAVSHRQGAVACGDVVVISLGALLQCVAEEVFTAAHQLLAAGVAVVRTLAVHKAVAGDLDLVLRQSRAVVLLRGALRGDGHIALAHRQGAVFRLDAELGRHVVAVAVLHDCCARYRRGVGSGIRRLGFRRQAGDGVGVALYGEGGRHQSGNALFRAVVLLRGALGGHGDLVLGVAVGHRQSAFGLGDDVVAGLGVVVQGVAERVGAAAHRLLAAGEGIACAFAVCPAAFRRKGGVSVGQSLAVILLAQVRRGQRYAPLPDGQRAVFRLYGELARHIVASRVLYHRRTRYLCGVGPGVRTLGRSRQAGDGVLVALQLKLRALEAGNALFRAVISVAAAVGLHRDLVLGLAVGHRQGAVACGDVVVISLGALLQCVAEEVFTAAHQLLAAGVAVVRTLAVHKAVAGDLDLVLRQSRAVVLLRGASRSDGHIPLCHRQRSVNPRNIFKRCCRGAGIFVHYFFCAGYCVIGFAGICLRAGHIDIIVQFELNSVCGVIAIRSFGQFLACIGNGVSIIGQCCPVVDLRAARGFYFKLFCICLCPVSVERGR